MANFDPIKSATDMVKQIRVSTVLSSILWILPFLIAALVVVSFTANLTVQYFLMYAVGILIVVFILSFLGILLFGDPKLLQSEDHIYRMKTLEVLGDQSNVVKDLVNSVVQNNPALPDPKNAVIPAPATNSTEEQIHE